MHVVQLVEARRLSRVARCRVVQADPTLRAVLLESTLLPEFSDSLRYRKRLPVFDSITIADFIHAATSPNPRFGSADPRFPEQVRQAAARDGARPRHTSTPTTACPHLEPCAPCRAAQYKEADLKTRWDSLDKEKMPTIGVLRIDYSYQPAPGDVDHPSSYYYRTTQSTSKGLTFEAAQEGKPLTAEQRREMQVAIAELEAQNVVGITGDCGFLMNYQIDARRIAKVPCFISSMLQCPLLANFFDGDEQILVCTANGKSLAPRLGTMLTACGVPKAQQSRFIVVGCENVDGFDAVEKGEKVDVPRVQPGMIDLVQREMAAAGRKVRAIMLECTELPPYADALRAATGLPVLDAITLVDFCQSAISDNPYFGIDFQRSSQRLSAAVEERRRESRAYSMAKIVE